MDDSSKVYVGNISYDVSEGELVSLFSQVGPIHNIQSKIDPSQGKAYAFITFKDAATASCAIKNLNNHEFHNRPLKVSLPDRPHTFGRQPYPPPNLQQSSQYSNNPIPLSSSFFPKSIIPGLSTSSSATSSFSQDFQISPSTASYGSYGYPPSTEQRELQPPPQQHPMGFVSSPSHSSSSPSSSSTMAPSAFPGSVGGSEGVSSDSSRSVSSSVIQGTAPSPLFYLNHPQIDQTVQRAVESFEKDYLITILKDFKSYMLFHPEQCRHLLIDYPQLTQALMQAMLHVGMPYTYPAVVVGHAAQYAAAYENRLKELEKDQQERAILEKEKERQKREDRDRLDLVLSTLRLRATAGINSQQMNASEKMHLLGEITKLSGSMLDDISPSDNDLVSAFLLEMMKDEK